MGPTHATDLERIKYNNPGLKVDLGVGLWAWPMPVVGTGMAISIWWSIVR